METKRLLLAFALMIVVVAGYNYFFMPTPPQTQPNTVQTPQQPTQKAPAGQPEKEIKSGALPDIFSTKTESTPQAQPAQPNSVSENIAGDAIKDITIENDLFKAVFTTKGAGLKSFILKKYKTDKKQPLDLISPKISEKFGNNLLYPFYFSPFSTEDTKKKLFLDLNNRTYAYNGNTWITLSPRSQDTTIEFKFADVALNLSVTKRFTFSPSSYVLKVDTSVTSNGTPIMAPILFGPDLEEGHLTERIMQTPLSIGAYNGDEIKRQEFIKIGAQRNENNILTGQGSMGNGYYWAAYETTYFAAIFKTRQNVDYYVIRQDHEKKQVMYSYMILSESKNLSVFIGPKDPDVLNSVEERYQFDSVYKAIDYGSFIFPMGPVARILHKGIMFAYSLIPNMGWAVILFTILLKVVLFPLTYASSVSMAKMQTLQPKIAAIKKKYKNLKDPEQRKQMNIETMGLYKQEKVNPAAGCLPLLLQMPILFAFFRLFPISISFRHEPWLLWFTDLSLKDPTYILPILMGASMMISSKMSPTSPDTSGVQKYMVYAFPLILTFVCLNYSAGLNLYWFISNLLQIAQQYYINKKIFSAKRVEEKERKAMKKKKGGMLS